MRLIHGMVALLIGTVAWASPCRASERDDYWPHWRGPAANAFRESVKNHECACPLANASYTNLLLDVPSLARVTANMAGLDGAKESK